MIKFYLLFFSSLIFWTCTHRFVSEKSYENLYKPKENDIKSSYFLFHLNDSISLLYYQYSNKDFLYKKYDTSEYHYADVSLFYSISSQPDAKIVIDSSTINLSHRLLNLQSMTVTGFLKLKIKSGTNGNVSIQINEKGSRKIHQAKLYFDKRTRFGQQNFLFTSSDSFPIFSGRFVKGDSVFFKNQRATGVRAKVNVYRKNLNLPPPPFSEKTPALPSEIADSVFYLDAVQGSLFKLKILSSGIYFIQIDTMMNEGCTLHGVDFDFPTVSSHEQMIACTRYVLSNDEYNRLHNAENKQDAIEEFWLKIGGNKDRTRELIRRYYARVRDANELFSSYQDGWRTDRGMIYIIFGYPDKVYLTQDKETWLYGKENTPQELLFRFSRRENRFSTNDFILDRSSFYKDPWFMAVMNWREGRVSK